MEVLQLRRRHRHRAAHRLRRQRLQRLRQPRRRALHNTIDNRDVIAPVTKPVRAASQEIHLTGEPSALTAQSRDTIFQTRLLYDSIILLVTSDNVQSGRAVWCVCMTSRRSEL